MASKYKAENEKDRCVACGVCVKVCPKDAYLAHCGGSAHRYLSFAHMVRVLPNG